MVTIELQGGSVEDGCGRRFRAGLKAVLSAQGPLATAQSRGTANFQQDWELQPGRGSQAWQMAGQPLN